MKVTEAEDSTVTETGSSADQMGLQTAVEPMWDEVRVGRACPMRGGRCGALGSKQWWCEEGERKSQLGYRSVIGLQLDLCGRESGGRLRKEVVAV